MFEKYEEKIKGKNQEDLEIEFYLMDLKSRFDKLPRGGVHS